MTQSLDDNFPLSSRQVSSRPDISHVFPPSPPPFQVALLPTMARLLSILTTALTLGSCTAIHSLYDKRASPNPLLRGAGCVRHLTDRR
jgi:hypothetical protein